jgi:hypothetical protein
MNERQRPIRQEWHNYQGRNRRHVVYSDSRVHSGGRRGSREVRYGDRPHQALMRGPGCRAHVHPADLQNRYIISSEV